MKTTIEGLSSERLEQEIANIYYTAHRDTPGKKVVEAEGSLLNLLWNEFEERMEAGAITPDTDYSPRDWAEGFYE